MIYTIIPIFQENMFGHSLINEFPMVFIRNYIFKPSYISKIKGSLLYLFSVYYRCMTSLFYAMKD